jgi:hypothetical protein
MNDAKFHSVAGVLFILGQVIASAFATEAPVPAPALPALHADPHIACFDGKFYIYPTTDSADTWQGSVVCRVPSVSHPRWQRVQPQGLHLADAIRGRWDHPRGGRVRTDPFNSAMQAWETTDFKTSSKIAVSTSPGSKHCSMIPITHQELETLRVRYPGNERECRITEADSSSFRPLIVMR